MKIFLTLFLTCCCAMAQQTQFYPLNPATSMVSTGSVPFKVPYPASGGGTYPSITNGAILILPFVASSYNDISGLGNNVTPSGSPTFTTGLGGGANQAVILNGTSQSMATASTTTFNLSAFTLVAWVNANSLANSFNSIICKDPGSTYYLMYIRSTGKLAMYVTLTSGAVNYDGTGSGTVTTGGWHQIVMTFSSSTGLIGYLDGAQDKSVSTSLAANSATAPVYIGTDAVGSSSDLFNGTIEGVIIYNRALSAAEVTTLYSNSAP